MATWTPPKWLKAVLFAVSLIPAVWVAAALASDFFNGTRLLGSNPIKEAEHFTGRWVLRFLAVTLAVPPHVRAVRIRVRSDPPVHLLPSRPRARVG
jgi:DMSO/TMAO reductase YedYZ heme-binding membrane subunit